MEIELEKEKQSKETIIATYQQVLQVLLGKLKDEEKKSTEEEAEVKKLKEILKNIEQEKEKQNEKIVELNQQLNDVKQEIHQLKQESISTLLSHTEASEKIGQEIKTEMIKLQQQVESVQYFPQKSQIFDNVENSNTKPFSYTLYNKYDHEEYSGGCHISLTEYEYNLYYYEKIKDLDIFEGYLTPTTVITPSEGNPDNFKDIIEIRYAHVMQFNSLVNPKVYFYRNKNKSCYIFIRFEEKILSVIYGIRELNIKIGNYSFLVYEVSSELDSFTDNTNRLIYVDKKGIYIVSKEENSIEIIVKRYREEGILKFEGLVITISALNGAIMFNNQCLFSKHFYNVFHENKIGSNTEFIPSKDQPIKEQYLKNFYGSCFSNYYDRKSINKFIINRINSRK